MFEMVGTIVVGELFRKTNIRFRNIKDFETFSISLDENGYESGDDVFLDLFIN